MVHRPPPCALVKTTLFLFVFLFKVLQTILKSMQLSPFVPLVIFGRIPESLKMVFQPTPCALVKTPLFLGGGV